MKKEARGQSRNKCMSGDDGTTRADLAPHELLVRAGVRATHPRVQVLETLMRAPRPTTIESLTRALAGKVNMVTVYRTVSLLLDKGLIEAVMGPNGTRLIEFQRSHHHHVRCTRCGKMAEVVLGKVERALMAKAQEVAAFTRVDRHVVEFFGECRACAGAA